MGKKKTNPNRKPIDAKSLDLHTLTSEITDRTVLRLWALVLGAFADYKDTTTDSLIGLWHMANGYSQRIQSFNDAEKLVKSVQYITGPEFIIESISMDGIRFEGELTRFTKKAERNAFNSGLAVVLRALHEQNIMNAEQLQKLYQKVQDLNDEVQKGIISLDDLLWVLEEEQNLKLSHGETGLVFERIEKDENVT